MKSLLIDYWPLLIALVFISYFIIKKFSRDKFIDSLLIANRRLVSEASDSPKLSESFSPLSRFKARIRYLPKRQLADLHKEYNYLDQSESLIICLNARHIVNSKEGLKKFIQLSSLLQADMYDIIIYYTGTASPSLNFLNKNNKCYHPDACMLVIV